MGVSVVNCGYCGFRNVQGEARCRRCGRKPGDLSAEFALPTEGALAALPKPGAANHDARSRAKAADLAEALQRPLFEDRPADNVIRFEQYRPVPLEPRRRKLPDPAKPHRPRSRVLDAQGSLDF